MEWHLFTCSFVTGELLDSFTSEFLILSICVSANKSPHLILYLENEMEEMKKMALSNLLSTAEINMAFLCYHFSFL